jgi:hypothetical protein
MPSANLMMGLGDLVVCLIPVQRYTKGANFSATAWPRRKGAKGREEAGAAHRVSSGAPRQR